MPPVNYRRVIGSKHDTVNRLIIHSLSTGGPYPQQR